MSVCTAINTLTHCVHSQWFGDGNLVEPNFMVWNSMKL